jgi:hypothetical protein
VRSQRRHTRRADGIRPPDRLVRGTGSEVIADVRVIQMPRSSASGCNADDPEVIAGVLLTPAEFYTSDFIVPR